MKLLNYLFKCILVVSSTATVFAKTLVISDIDDTIKMSHVNSFIDNISNAYRTDIPFKDMPVLYSELIKVDSVVQFYYVSSAPSILMQSSHSEFLVGNYFPKGGLYLREKSIDKVVFKVSKISEIIYNEKPNRVILIGDNGENDPIIFNEILRKFSSKKIEFLSLIRIAYGKHEGTKLFDNQLSFITGGEAALYLYDLELITSESAKKVLLYTLYNSKYLIHDSHFYIDANLGLPDWIKCDQHAIDFSKFYSIEENLTPYFEYLSKQKCKE